jgi:hypothetical protein
MRLALVFLAASLLLAGCAPSTVDLMRPPHFSAALSRSPYPALKSAIDGMIPDSLFPPSNVGIKIVSLRTGSTLYDLNSTMLFNPASNQKLFTGATAHALLGPSFALNTIITLDTVAGIIRVRSSTPGTSTPSPACSLRGFHRGATGRSSGTFRTSTTPTGGAGGPGTGSRTPTACSSPRSF